MPPEAPDYCPDLPSLMRNPGGERLVSFAQNAEDIRLWRVFRNLPTGRYADIGAADPKEGSVTKFFYDRGWSGLNVEPGPAYDKLSAARSKDSNVRCVVGTSSGEVDLWVTYPDLGMSTTDLSVHDHVAHRIEHAERSSVPCKSLADLFTEHCAADERLDFLKVDVEGSEADVFASNDWRRFRPSIILAECVASWDSAPRYEKWEPLLIAAGYEFAAFDGLNRFYVDGAYSHLRAALAYPISPLDCYVTAHQADLESRLRARDAEDATACRILAEPDRDLSSPPGANQRSES